MTSASGDILNGKCVGGPLDGKGLTHDKRVKVLVASNNDGVAGEYHFDDLFDQWTWKPERTEHLYEGKPDARQGDAHVKPGRFAMRYRMLTPQEVELIDLIKKTATELEELILQTPGRYSSLAMTSLEMAVMWSVKEIAK